MKATDKKKPFSGKAFEEIVMQAGDRHRKAKEMIIGRFGTTVTLVNGKWMPVPSLPDFDCVLYGGRQVVIEAKVTTKSTFDLQKATLKPLQVRYMLERSSFGVPCFLIVHYHERELKTKPKEEAVTALIPVSGDDPRWADFVKTKHGAGINRAEALSMGTAVEWTASGRQIKLLPDVFTAVQKLKHLFNHE